jgi:threonine 3-dehydrogenase
MTQDCILVTGAGGEIGRALITRLAECPETPILALDVRPLDPALEAVCERVVVGDILDQSLLDSLSRDYAIGVIYHLAALLSTSAEHHPVTAHRVNVNGTLNLLEIAQSQIKQQDHPVKFVFPSSIAVYGLPDLETKARTGKVHESEWCDPRTMYGINKLYCEHLGQYYARRVGVDFRCLRFPGLISAETLPTGGTSDYAPEMLHRAARGESYACFVRADTQIPFMAMPDAIEALTCLAGTPRRELSRRIYNVGSFSASAAAVFDVLRNVFPNAAVTFEPDPTRQSIVDSWPQDVDDTAFRADTHWAPRYGFERAFYDYLVPAVVERYRSRAESSG